MFKKEEGPIKLNLGCGERKLNGWINIDIREEVNPDLLYDIEKGLPYKDNSVDDIRAWDFLEHISNEKKMFVIEEIYRVLKPNGIFEFFIPSTDGRGAFQDPTHKSFWNKNSWLYYYDDEHRSLYGIKAKFEFGTLNDVVSDNVARIIHTHGIGKAIKKEDK